MLEYTSQTVLFKMIHLIHSLPMLTEVDYFIAKERWGTKIWYTK